MKRYAISDYTESLYSYVPNGFFNDDLSSFLSYQVRNSFKLKEIMKRILFLGNILNQGTARGKDRKRDFGPL